MIIEKGSPKWYNTILGILGLGVIASLIANWLYDNFILLNYKESGEDIGAMYILLCLFVYYHFAIFLILKFEKLEFRNGQEIEMEHPLFFISFVTIVVIFTRMDMFYDICPVRYLFSLIQLLFN